MRGMTLRWLLVGALCAVAQAAAACASTTPIAEPVGTNDYVVLLHGLARSAGSMGAMEERLTEEGYRVVNIDYPSTDHPIEELVAFVSGEIEAACTDTSAEVHFVTHSLGGIVVRAYLKQQPPTDNCRVVMLSPPNQGSEIVDWLGDTYLFRAVMGPAGQQLGTDSASTPNTLGPVDFELGVITGDASLNPVFSRIISGPDDGKVSVERARVGGMRDFLVVPHSHPFIMSRPVVIEQTVFFLEHGRFRREDK